MDAVLSPAAAFVARTGRAPLIWGQNDCATWAAHLWWEVHGVDPAATLRDSYRTWHDCRLLLMRSGGLLALSRQLMARWPAGGTGDGICVAKTGPRVIAGVLSGDRLWLKTDGGVTSPATFDILDRWTL